MAQGRPPRRTKSKRDSVTIDGKAERVGAKDETQAKAQPEQAKGEADKATPAAGAKGASKQAAADTAGASRDMPKVSASAATPAESKAAGADPDAGKPETGKTGPDDTAKATSANRTGTAKPGSTPGTAQTASGGAKPAAAASTAAPGAGTSRDTVGEKKPGAAAEAPGGSGARGFVAGLVGGIIAVAVLFLLQEAHVIPVPGDRAMDVSSLRSSVASLGGEVASLKTSVADLQNAAASGEAASQAQAIDSRLSALSQKVDSLQSGAQSAGGAESGAVEALKSSVATLQSNGKDMTGRVDALAKKVDTLSAQVSSAGGQAQLVKAIAATALKSAIDRGGSFSTELQAYASVAPDDAATGRLKELAAGGVPSRQQLQADFPKAEDAILSAVDGNADNAGVFDRLLSSAKSLVKVRPTGNLPGDTPDAVAARMAMKLNSGDLQGVVDEWTKLPQAGKKASQSFIDEVKARLQAETLASAALKRAMPATGSQG